MKEVKHFAFSVNNLNIIDKIPGNYLQFLNNDQLTNYFWTLY